MPISDFIGMRKVTIRNTATGSTSDFTVLAADNLGSDGVTITIENNELTVSSFAGDVTVPNGINLGASTLQLLPLSIDDLRALWPAGYDATTNSWGIPVGGCAGSDSTLAIEKVCDTKGNIILKHCQIAPAFELSITRDDAPAVEVNIYPSLSPGSEYGLTGDLADTMFPYRVFNGTYDPSTDTITYDTVTPPSGD